jgi:hypothetical protein
MDGLVACGLLWGTTTTRETALNCRMSLQRIAARTALRIIRLTHGSIFANQPSGLRRLMQQGRSRTHVCYSPSLE